MKKAGSYILIFFIRIYSWFPLWYLLICSSVFFYFLYYIFRYRKKIVRANLANSFPQKSSSELKAIESEYYKHLCDLIVENIWASRASEKLLQKHCPIKDIEVFQKLYDEKKDFICLLGHIGNWEWCNLSYNTYHLNHLMALYRPLRNESFDEYFIKYRSRFGAQMVPMQQMPRVINQDNTHPYVLAFIADQSPVPEYAHWTQFLNQDTCFFNGYDKVARKKDLPVVLAYLEKVRRGHYQMRVELLDGNPASLSKNEITELYAKRIEQVINANPEHWLWSHRRWKHKRKV